MDGEFIALKSMNDRIQNLPQISIHIHILFLTKTSAYYNPSSISFFVWENQPVEWNRGWLFMSAPHCHLDTQGRNILHYHIIPMVDQLHIFTGRYQLLQCVVVCSLASSLLATCRLFFLFPF
mmetsp:Transcript_8621/g.12882  ORF Transcript_8621/g.12882 Transcript_8621/m.12882 type:complete len:122 (-) Transcript_8621:494-859(-)